MLKIRDVDISHFGQLYKIHFKLKFELSTVQVRLPNNFRALLNCVITFSVSLKSKHVLNGETIFYNFFLFNENKHVN